MDTAGDGVVRWSLVQLLGLLSMKNASAQGQSARNAAARQLMNDMGEWAKAVVWKQLGKSLRGLPAHEAREVVASSVQALAIAASTSNEPFAGDSELAARAWCRRVMLNHAVSELRLRAARRPVAAPASDTDEDEPEPLLDEASMTPVQRQLASVITSLRAVRRQVRDTRRPRDVPSTMKAIWCYLAYLSGATLDEQLLLLDLKANGGDTRRQRNLVYKLRERGRKALRDAYGVVQDE